MVLLEIYKSKTIKSLAIIGIFFANQTTNQQVLSI